MAGRIEGTFRQLDTGNREDVALYVQGAQPSRDRYGILDSVALKAYIASWTEPEAWYFEGAYVDAKEGINDPIRIGMVLTYNKKVAGYFLQNYWCKGDKSYMREIARVSLEKIKDYVERHNAQFHPEDPQQMILRMQRDAKGDTRMFFKANGDIPVAVLSVVESIFPYVNVEVVGSKHNDVRIGTEPFSPSRHVG